MTSLALRAIRAAVLAAILALLTTPALAQTLFHLAENRVQVAVVKIERTTNYTAVHLQTQIAMKGVCWYAEGANSPYLLAEGNRYGYLGGSNVTACPKQQPYADKEIMVLRFKPLAAQARTFSLVEGQGGENQMIDPKASKERFWNFLRVKLN